MNKKMLILFAFILILIFFTIQSKRAFANDNFLNVAVSSNFLNSMKKISKKFEREKKIKVIITSGSSAKLYVQIINGAPFDIFFSADTDKPNALIVKDFASKESFYIYAIGKLALWTPGININENNKYKIEEIVNLISIPNPKLAPYGLAAKQFLLNIDKLEVLKKRIITAENVTQSFNLILSKNVSGGFVALSQLIKLNSQVNDTDIFIISDSLYSPIYQGCVILKKSKNNNNAQLLLKYIKSECIKEIIRKSGYKVNDI